MRDAVFPYPGDDPFELIPVSSAFCAAQSRLDSVNAKVGEVEASMTGNWRSEAASKAAGDLIVLQGVLGAASADLRAAATAVTTYRAVLVSIRLGVDGLRVAVRRQQIELSGQQGQYGRAAFFGEANGMTTAQLTSYRSGIASQEAGTQRGISHLEV